MLNNFSAAILKKLSMFQLLLHIILLILTRASNAKIQVPLISLPVERDDDDDDDGRVEELIEAELEKVKPLNLQSSLPASTNKSNRSDFMRSSAWSFRHFLWASSHTPNCMIAPKEW